MYSLFRVLLKAAFLLKLFLAYIEEIWFLFAEDLQRDWPLAEQREPVLRVVGLRVDVSALGVIRED